MLMIQLLKMENTTDISNQQRIKINGD